MTKEEIEYYDYLERDDEAIREMREQEEYEQTQLYIEQLQQENEELKKQVDQLQKQNEKALAIIDRLEFKK